MTAMLSAERPEPDVARYIDTFKYDQDTSERRTKFGGGTSLPLDSDGYEDRQRKLKQELRNDFLVQQEKKRNLEVQRVQARRSQPPPPAPQPQGGQLDYNQQNQQARLEDRRAYQDHMAMSEQGKFHHQPTVGSVKPPINYEEERKRLSEELKQDYVQFQEKKAQEERYWRMRGKPVTPPGGLDIGLYDKHLKEHAPQKKREYKETLDQQKDAKLRHKAWERVAEVSPSHMHYRDDERPLVGSPRDVNFHMHEQQKEHMLIRARQEPEMPVLDRSVQQHANYVSSKPPPGPQQAHYVQRDELSHRQTPNYWNEGKRERSPASQLTESSKQTGKDNDVPSAFRTTSYAHPQDQEYMAYRERAPPMDSQANNGYNSMDRQQNPGPPRSPQKSRKTPPPPLELDQYNYSNGRNQPGSQNVPPIMNGERRGYQPSFQGQRSQERSGQTSRQTPPAFQTQINGGGYRPSAGTDRRSPSKDSRKPDSQGQGRAGENPPIGGIYVFDDSRQDQVKRQIYEMKKNDYNEFLKKKQEEQRLRHDEARQHRAAPAPVLKDHHYSSDEYVKYKKSLQQQDSEDYRQYLQKQRVKDAPRRHDYLDHRSTGPYEGIFSGLGDHGNTKETLGQQRRQEYNDRLDQYPQAKASGRPTWVKETLPNSKEGSRSPMRNPHQVDHYQQMLDEKRREEAQRRRFDDHDYQGRNPRDDRHMSDMQQKYDYYPGE